MGRENFLALEEGIKNEKHYLCNIMHSYRIEFSDSGRVLIYIAMKYLNLFHMFSRKNPFVTIIFFN